MRLSAYEGLLYWFKTGNVALFWELVDKLSFLIFWYFLGGISFLLFIWVNFRVFDGETHVLMYEEELIPCKADIFGHFHYENVMWLDMTLIRQHTQF